MPNGELRPAQSLTMVLAKLLFCRLGSSRPSSRASPSAFRRWRDERRLFLLCLSLPAIVLFTLTPLWGGRGQPHWTMPGWFFAFALMGAWVDELGVSSARFAGGLSFRRRCSLAIAGVAVVQVVNRLAWAILTARSGILPIRCWRRFDWRDLRKAPIFDAAARFVISTKWSDAGKIALALGPQIPVFVLSNDPRGWAFQDESESFVGQSGVIVTPAAELASTSAVARPLFAKPGTASALRAGPGRPLRDQARAHSRQRLDARTSHALSGRDRQIAS